MQSTIQTTSNKAETAHRISVAALIALAILCVAWEWWLAPIREGGSWLVLKALPLAIPIYKIFATPATRRYTYQWCTLLIWLYFTEGCVRAWSDLVPLSQGLALLEVGLCVTLLVAAIIYIRNTPSHLVQARPSE